MTRSRSTFVSCCRRTCSAADPFVAARCDICVSRQQHMAVDGCSMQLPHLSRQFCARLQQSYSKCEVVQYTAVVRISLCLIDTQS